MSRPWRIPTLAACALVALATAIGCGLGPGRDSSSDASVLVTEGFGAREVGSAATPVNASSNVLRQLQQQFDVSTRYGGGFVQSIDKRSGGMRDGRSTDWFFYVNGVQPDVGAAKVKLRAGDRVQWDRHDWSATMKVPAIVGAYPEPFRSGIDGKFIPVRIDCADSSRAACKAVQRALARDGITASLAGVGTPAGQELLRVVVGPWPTVRRDPAVRQIERGPQVSGVYARPAADGSKITVLDPRGRPARTLRGDSGLIAATRLGDQAPTWVVTGTSEQGIMDATGTLSAPTLQGKFALAVADDAAVRVPLVAGAAGETGGQTRTGAGRTTPTQTAPAP